MNYIFTSIRLLQAIDNEDTRFFKTQQFMLRKETRDACDRRVVAVLAMALNPSMLDLQQPADFLMRQQADRFLSQFLIDPATNTDAICDAFDVWKQQDVEETQKYVQDRMVDCYLHQLDDSYFAQTLVNMGKDPAFLSTLSFEPITAYTNEWEALMNHLAPHPLVQRYAAWRQEKMDVRLFLQQLHRSTDTSVERLLRLV